MHGSLRVKFLRYLTDNRKKNRIYHGNISCRALANVSPDKDYRFDSQTIWKTRFLQIHTLTIS